MSTISQILSFVLFVRIIKFFVEGFGKSPIVKFSEIKEAKTKTFNVKYYSNGIQLDGTIRNHYYHLLELYSKPVIHPTIIYKSYKRNLFFLKEDKQFGQKTKCAVQDLKAAKTYLFDLCDYFGNLN